jgi:hypothetical protein
MHKNQSILLRCDGSRLRSKKNRVLPPPPSPQVVGNKEPHEEEDSLSELDLDTVDITYVYRNHQADAVRPRRRDLEPGDLEGYYMILDSAPLLQRIIVVMMIPTKKLKDGEGRVP